MVNKIAAVVFIIVALLHSFRISHAWVVIVGNTMIPMWISWVSMIVAVILAYALWRAKK